MHLSRSKFHFDICSGKCVYADFIGCKSFLMTMIETVYTVITWLTLFYHTDISSEICYHIVKI